ncbi:MAG: CPBP family intramembrane metalloprotease [Chloroflexi bacterium]|nr:CPBP family intramembrane metalloprotease [Chloroflexota bacterium]
MISDTMALVIYLIIISVFSVYWGKATRLARNGRVANALAHQIMRYSRIDFEPAKAYTLWFIYVFTGIFGATVLLLAYDVEFTKYLSLKREYIVYILIGMVAQLSLSSLILQLYDGVIKKIDWVGVVTDISWIRIMQLMPKVVRALYPTSGAFSEELFFRGAVLIIIIEQFPQLNPGIAILIPTLLFTLQQVLHAESNSQKILLTAGSVSISVFGSILVLYTGSFIPTLICHELYVIFYLGPGIFSGTLSSGEMPPAARHGQRMSF